jgi:hypothetical protein
LRVISQSSLKSLMKNKLIDLLLYLDIPVNFDEEIEIILC